MRTITLGPGILGENAPQVSEFCLGTMRFGWATPEGISLRLLDQYAEAGGFFLDTANIYGRIGAERTGAVSEQLLGRWMRDRGNRKELFVATKVGFQYADVARGLTAAQITEEAEKSLRRLDTDYLDLYYAHVDDQSTPL